MSTDHGLTRFLEGRNLRAKSEANQIIADARRVAYRMVQEAGELEQRTIAELKQEIGELKAERMGLRRSLARSRVELKKLAKAREVIENEADTYGADLKLRARQQADQVIAKAKQDAQAIRADADRARKQAEADGARLAGMTCSELDEARRRGGLSRLHIATAEAYPHHHECRLAA